MKIKIKVKDFNIENFKFFLVNEFPNVRFWELPKNKLLAQKNKVTGCYIIPKARNIRLIAGFPNMQTNIIAIIFIILGGIIIPLIYYYIFFYKAQKRFMLQIEETIAQRYSKHHLINKTVN